MEKRPPPVCAHALCSFTQFQSAMPEQEYQVHSVEWAESLVWVQAKLSLIHDKMICCRGNQHETASTRHPDVKHNNICLFSYIDIVSYGQR